MHYVAGALLIAQFVLMWIGDETIDVKGLEYLAWAGWVVAMVLLFLPVSTLRRRGHVQAGKRYVETEALVDTGVYAAVRHPQYLGWMSMYAVALLFKPSWLVAIPGALGAICVYRFTVQEEALLIEKFGESYRRYMQKVPRFNLPTGIIRLLGGRGRS